MSHISIALVDATPSRDVVEAVRSVTDAPIGTIVEAISHDRPIYEKELRARPQEDNFAAIRRLLENLEGLSLHLRILENGRDISAERLRNIMRSSEENERQLRELDELGHS